jgi:uncharacterized protein YydD (DUF2326 family)
MIHRISSPRESFKDVEFSEHFNVVLAERTESASARDSRNGSGKSSLIEILHFCLGSGLRSTLAEDALQDWTFSTTFDAAGANLTASRNTSAPNRIRIDGVKESWRLEERKDQETGEAYYTLDD